MVELRIGVPKLELMKIQNKLHLTSDCQARINYGVLGLIIVIVLPISELKFFSCSVAPSTSSVMLRAFSSQNDRFIVTSLYDIKKKVTI